MRRNEDGHAVVARQIDERLPEGVAGDRVHPRGRFVEDQHGWAVQNRDGELQPLLYAKRQALGTSVGNELEVVALQQLLDAAADFFGRQMVELRVQLQIL